MNGNIYDQIALALHEQLVQADGPVLDDHESGLVANGVEHCIDALVTLFTARDQLWAVLGGVPEFDAGRFVRLAREGGEL
jgi:hypothetical protein